MASLLNWLNFLGLVTVEIRCCSTYTPNHSYNHKFSEWHTQCCFVVDPMIFRAVFHPYPDLAPPPPTPAALKGLHAFCRSCNFQPCQILFAESHTCISLPQIQTHTYTFSRFIFRPPFFGVVYVIRPPLQPIQYLCLD